MKMKKNVLIAVSVLALSALVLTGCGKEKTEAQNPPTQDQTPEKPGEQTPGSTQETSLLKVSEMLGKTDDEVKDLFDGGTENKTEDGSTLLGRSYQTTLDGNVVTIETLYSAAEKVESLTLSYSDKKPEDVKKIMTDAFGEAEVMEEKDDTEAQYLKWAKDGVAITFNENYGMAIVEFTQAQA